MIAFADEDVLDNGPQLQIRGAVPQLAPIAALDLRMHRYADSPAWIDAWRMGALRTIAARQLDNTAQYAAAATHVAPRSAATSGRPGVAMDLSCPLTDHEPHGGPAGAAVGRG